MSVASPECGGKGESVGHLGQFPARESRVGGSLRSPVLALLSRPPQDISLEEFDDEDLSEITDDCGLGLSYDSDHCEKDGLSLGRSEQPHPICSFQDDFQDEDSGGEASEEEAGAALLGREQGPGDASPGSPDLTFSRKFLNVFVNSTSRSSSTESFGLFSCLVNGEEREQTHRAVFRFIPRHPDELELDVDDPVLVEAEEDDFWFRGFNMRTGERGVFPAFYAHVVPGPAKDLLGSKRGPCWVERFDVQFLGSVEVPCHQGNGILCAAMQKIATARKLTVHLRPPASCDLEISLRGVKLSLSGGPEVGCGGLRHRGQWEGFGADKSGRPLAST
ncbi:hypothetical protein E2I00_004716 [Balaenoptera physalus]|uniref:SH3 domain-containing protein n=1 Tax=Balaenoptera physalus TaxID=9770 RepID=A0A643CAL6_BALPH|nr:hypothetical protein E2I00_004716 [Balaenoptera physalus]